MMRFESGLSNLTTAAVMLVACQGLGGNGGEAIGASRASTGGRTVTHLETATFAGGCFWCMEAPFERINGVVEVLSGYAGGPEHNPTYTEVASGQTGHTESIQIRFDPTRVRYADLLQLFWRQIDPTDGGGQFVDRGSQYRTAIFVHGEQQRRVAEASKMELADSGRYDRPIVTEIVEAGRFYAAEEYHQDFYKKSAARYHEYRRGSGRDQYIDEVWGDQRDYVPEPAKQSSTTKYSKPDDAKIKAHLSPLQLEVTQRQGTEPPFSNEYWDNKKVGIYVDIVSGEPLFSSRDKFDSGTGWPSFTRPLESSNIVEEGDNRLMMKRTEVRSKHGDSHLGHLFPDGPAPTGLRYCINSASLRFIPREDLKMEGYDRFSTLFD